MSYTLCGVTGTIRQNSSIESSAQVENNTLTVVLSSGWLRKTRQRNEECHVFES